MDATIVDGVNVFEDSGDLTYFPQIKAGASLLRKYLTEDIWNELRDESDEYGYKFRDAIFAGCKDTDSRIGVYAGSHDSYKRFAALYNPIIQQRESKYNSATKDRCW